MKRHHLIPSWPTASTGGGGGGFIAPASVITPGGPYYYNNQITDTMNYASESAGASGPNAISFYTPSVDAAAWGFLADPAGGGNNVWYFLARATEQGRCASFALPSAASYVYFQWEEYYDPAWNTAYAGKMNRMDGGSGAIDHILYGGPAVANSLGLLMQGSDGGENCSNGTDGTSTAVPRGQWVTFAHEEFLDNTTGYARLSYNYGSGWNRVNMGYNYNGVYTPNRNEFNASSSGGVGTLPAPGRQFTTAQIGGWYSGAPSDPTGTNYRYFRNVKILYNTTTAPHP